MGGIYIKDREILDMVSKVSSLRDKDEALYKEKVEELKATIGEDKVQQKLDEIDRKYGDELNRYVKKITQLKKTASNEEIANIVLDMKEKLSKEDQKRFDKILKMAKGYLKDL